MKNKKIKIIITALLCALIVSAGVFAISANADDKTTGSDNKNSPVTLFNTSGEDNKEFKFKDGELPELPKFPELPEGLEPPERPDKSEWAEKHTFKADGEDGFSFGFGIGIGGIKEFFGSENIDIADFLGITEEEFHDRLKAGGNIFKILEDAGKLDEYKDMLLQSFKDKLDAQVAAGNITQEKADEAYEILKESVNNFSGEDCGPRISRFGGHIKEFRVPDGFDDFDGFRDFEKFDKFGDGSAPVTNQNFEIDLISM